MSRNTCAFNNFQINVNPKLSRSPSVLRDIHPRIFSCTKRIECRHTLRTLCAESKISLRRANQYVIMIKDHWCRRSAARNKQRSNEIICNTSTIMLAGNSMLQRTMSKINYSLLKS